MYKKDSELTGISFNIAKKEHVDDYYDINNHEKFDNPYCKEDQLNLFLSISHEIIEDISTKDETIRINNQEELKKDILIERRKYYRIFGKSIDNKGRSYKDVLIRLYKYTTFCGNVERKELDKVLTNEYGEFNFVMRVDMQSNLESYQVEIDSYYKIL
ncbi:MAG: hypothetical protein ACRC6T_09150 [Sarcina sp.]